MKNQELFDKTVSILVKAYQDGTLEHRECSACAVGNILGSGDWGKAFCTEYSFSDLSDAPILKYNGTHIQRGDLGRAFLPELTHVKIARSGYSYEELSDIEWAFETVDRGDSADEYMFNGLMSVIDTLMVIHSATPQEAESAKLQFVKA